MPLGIDKKYSEEHCNTKRNRKHVFGREVVKDLIKKEVRKRAFDTNWRKSVPGGGSCKYKGPEAGIISKFLKIRLSW